jgi:hypothetical protein
MLQLVGGTLDTEVSFVSRTVRPLDRDRVDLRAGVNDVGKGRACTSARNQTLVIQ